MQKNRLLTTALLTLTLAFSLVNFNSAFAQSPDTVFISSVQVDPDPVNPVAFAVPVNLYADDTLNAGSLGHYYDSDDIRIDSISYTGGVAAGTIPYPVVDTANNLAAIGFVYFPGFPGAEPVYPGHGLLATMWFTLEAGAPDQVINIDSGYFPPAGDYILTGSDGVSRFPHFVAGTITVGSPAPPELAVSPTSLTFDATVGGGNPAPQSFDISNAGSGDMAWTATEDATWFGLSASSGTAPPTATVDVSVNITGLTAGTYIETVLVEAPGAANSPQEVQVTLNLTEAPPEIAVDPLLFTFESVQGTKEVLYDTLNITNVGGGTLNWSASKSELWLVIAPTSGTAPSEVELSVTTDGLSAGVYEDTVEVTAPDAINSPVKVPVILNILESAPVLNVTPDSLYFEATAGGADPSPQIVTVSNDGGQTLSWSAAVTSGWLSIDPSAGSLTSGLSEDISASILIGSLTPGTYFDTITVSGNADNSPQEVQVVLEISEAGPEIFVNPAAFNFETAVNTNPVDQTMDITNTGGGDLNFTLSNLSGWLTLNPTSGAAPETITLSVNTAGLTVGTYRDTITVTSAAASNSPVEVPVRLDVTEAEPVIVLDQTQFTFTLNEGDNQDMDVLGISNGGGGTLFWSASNLETWLSLDPTSGTAPSNVNLTVSTLGLSLGTYYDTISVVGVGATNSPQIAEVVLNVVEEAQPQFVVTPASLEFSATEGQNPGARNLNIASDGAALNWLASYSSTWLTLDMVSGTTPSDVSVSADVAGQMLAPGVYHDTIVIVEDVTPRVADPVAVPVMLTVQEAGQPNLVVDPLALNFEATEGGSDPAPQSVNVTNVGDGTLDWTASYDAAWITVSPLSGTAPSSIDIGIDIAGLMAGTYIDTVTITAAGALNSPQYVVVNLLLNPPSSQGGDTVWVSTESTLLGQQAVVEINFTNDNLIAGIQIPLYFDTSIVVCDSVSFAGSRVENVDLLLSPIDSVAGTVNIGVVPTESDLIPEGSGLMARLYFTGLATGFSPIDTGFIPPASEYVFVDENVLPFYPVFHSGGVDVSEPVTPCIEVDPVAISFVAVESGADPEDQLVTVTNCGTGELSWTAALLDGTWLSIDPASGGDGTVITLSASITGLTPGDYNDEVIITDPAASNSPVSVPVLLTVQEPGPAKDTVKIESVTVVSSPTDSVVFGVPVNLYADDSLAAGSLGHYYDSDDIRIDSISYTGGVAVGTIPYPVVEPENHLAAIGFVYMPGLPGAHPVPPGHGLLATLWFTLEAGAADQVINIDSGYFPPAGDYILTGTDGVSRFPDFVAGTITVMSEVAPPILSVTPDTLLFEGEEGGINNVVKNVYINNMGGGELIWSASYDAPWLGVSPTAGTGPDSLDVEVDLSGLSAGTYVDSIMISAEGAQNSPQYVEVTLEVTSAPVPGEIGGMVMDAETELPIADAVVELYDIYPGTPLATTLTRPDGGFLFVDMMPGDYVIRAYKDGYYPANLEYTLSKEQLILMLAPVQEIIETYEWVNFYCDNNYLDGQPIMPGDVIEAYDPTGVLCGQFFVTETGSYGFMPVYRDDEFTDPDDEGCEPGDAVSFTINGYPAETSADAIWTENGDNWEICLNAQSIITKCFELQEGWQLISWNVDTEVDDVETLIAGIKSSIDVILSFETGALTYDPNLADFNTLSEMDHFHGYWFRMLEPATFCVTGPLVDPTTPIALEAGWNLSSYLPNQQDSLEHALQSIMDYLLAVLAFYDGGVSYDPNLGEFSTLQVMMPMFGYWIKVSDDIMLTYPGEAGPTFAKSVPDVFSDNSNPFDMKVTNRWIDMFGSGVTVDGAALGVGTVIEAVDRNGVVCGTYTVDKPGMFGFMPVYGAEDGSADGLTAGDEFHLRVNGRESGETFTYGEEGDRILVTSLHLKSGSSNAVPTTYSLSQNYPNPVQPRDRDSFRVAGRFQS